MRIVEQALQLVAPAFCWACGGPSRPHDPLCLRCRARLRWLEDRPLEIGGLQVWAPVAYEGPAQALVRGLKFRGAVGLAGTLAAQIAASAPSDLLVPPAVLVPVPLHPARARKRGFNQAERIAAALARRTGLPVSDCLMRTGDPRAPQVGKGRSERVRGIAGTVELRSRAHSPRVALLVDDVATTGATLAACAEALRLGGAATVAACAYACTPGR